MESVRHYKYLGVQFSLNGGFTDELTDLYHRGQKAFFLKFVQHFSNLSVNIDLLIYGPQREKMYLRTIFCLLENQFYFESILFLASNSLYLTGLI